MYLVTPVHASHMKCYKIRRFIYDIPRVAGKRMRLSFRRTEECSSCVRSPHLAHVKVETRRCLIFSTSRRRGRAIGRLAEVKHTKATVIFNTFLISYVNKNGKEGRTTKDYQKEMPGRGHFTQRERNGRGSFSLASAGNCRKRLFLSTPNKVAYPRPF